MGKKIDLTGQRFGRLVVVKDTGKKYTNRSVIWECVCDCGNKRDVVAFSLKNEDTQSCGCMSIEQKKTIGKEKTVPRFLYSKKSKANTSGIKGVYWDKRKSTWKACIGFKGKLHHLGYFDNKQDAINARKEAEEKYFQPILEKYGKEPN